MPISTRQQGRRWVSLITQPLTTPNAPSSHGRGPFPQLLSKPASQQSAHPSGHLDFSPFILPCPQPRCQLISLMPRPSLFPPMARRNL